MKNIIFPLIGCCCLSSCANKERKSDLHNIIFILTDDQGYGDMGSAGQFPARHNVHHIYSDPDFDKKNGTPVFLDPQVQTGGDLKKNAGYNTGYFGKWHLCGNESGSPTPEKYGFDTWLISYKRKNLADQKPEIVSELKTILLEWKKTIPESEY